MALNSVQGAGLELIPPHTQVDAGATRGAEPAGAGSGATIPALPGAGRVQAHAPAPATGQGSQGAPTEKQVAQAAAQANAHLSQQNHNVRFAFSVDSDTKQVVVKLLDSQTGDLIREIPSKELLAISKNLEKTQGLLLKHKA